MKGIGYIRRWVLEWIYTDLGAGDAIYKAMGEKVGMNSQ